MPVRTCRIIVSAPNGTANSAIISNAGAVYVCPVQMAMGGECSPLLGDENGDDRRLYDTEGNNLYSYNYRSS